MTDFIYIKGKTKWFRHVKPELFKEKESWSHTIYPDSESLEKIRELQAQGMKNILKKDEDGYYIKFSRPTKIKARAGHTISLEPPAVVLKGSNDPYTGPVGDNSDVITKLEVYQHAVPGGGKAKAARWLSSRVDNLAEYKPPYTVDAPDVRALKGLDKQEEQKIVYDW